MIVETCINLSIKIVKIGRKLRETKTNNEILKAQMDEVINSLKNFMALFNCLIFFSKIRQSL